MAETLPNPPTFSAAEWSTIADHISASCDSQIDAAALLRVRNPGAVGVRSFLNSVRRAKRLIARIDASLASQSSSSVNHAEQSNAANTEQTQ